MRSTVSCRTAAPEVGAPGRARTARSSALGRVCPRARRPPLRHAIGGRPPSRMPARTARQARGSRSRIRLSSRVRFSQRTGSGLVDIAALAPLPSRAQDSPACQEQSHGEPEGQPSRPGWPAGSLRNVPVPVMSLSQRTPPWEDVLSEKQHRWGCSGTQLRWIRKKYPVTRK